MEHGNPLELLKTMESLGLLADAQAATLRAEWSDDGTISTDQALEQLVDRQVITAYRPVEPVTTQCPISAADCRPNRRPRRIG